MKKFMDYFVPDLTSDGFASCVCNFNRPEEGRLTVCSDTSINCNGLSCRKCLLGIHHEGTEQKRLTFISYAETKGYILRDGKLVKKIPSGMPELKPGMIVKTKTGPYIICATSAFGYALYPSYKGVPLFGDLRYISPEDIVTVYGDPDGRFLCLDTITEIVKNLGARFTLWKKPNEPRKLTVKEVSEKLGYPVEIVAEEEK